MEIRKLQPLKNNPQSNTRRKIVGIVLVSIAALATFAYALVRTFLRWSRPNLYEPSTVFRIGKPTDFTIGVNTKFLEKYRIYVVRNAERLFVVYGRCTHLGCTTDWKPQENKFVCPCHSSGFCLGSSFDQDGINCGGPAQRPLDRAKVEIDPEGNIVVDTAILYEHPKEGANQFDDQGAYIQILSS